MKGVAEFEDCIDERLEGTEWAEGPNGIQCPDTCKPWLSWELSVL